MKCYSSEQCSIWSRVAQTDEDITVWMQIHINMWYLASVLFSAKWEYRFVSWNYQNFVLNESVKFARLTNFR